MKPILIALVLLTGALEYVSCKKNIHVRIAGSNKPPIADAGKDTIIILPMDRVKLDGSASNDPDGTISSFQWTKISGSVSLTSKPISPA